MNNVVGAFFNESFVEKKRFVTLKNSACDSLENTETCFSMKKKYVETQTHCISTVPKLVLRIQFLCLTEQRHC